MVIILYGERKKHILSLLTVEILARCVMRERVFVQPALPLLGCKEGGVFL